MRRKRSFRKFDYLSFAELTAVNEKHNRLTSSELLSNDRRAVDLVSSQLRFSEASLSLIEEV